MKIRTFLIPALAALIVTLTVISAGAAETVASGECGYAESGLTWVLTDDGVLTISGSGTMDGYTAGDAPWYSKRTKITSIVIEDGVTNIGERAFEGCSALTCVTIPESVTIIGNYAFLGCTKLAAADLPAGVTGIGFNAFQNCASLTDVVLPAGVTEIGWSTFSGCTALTSVTIPEGVTSIGYGAFDGCTSLTDLVLPASVTEIDWYAFANCSSLTAVVIPEGVTAIQYGTFEGCSKLSSVTIPGSVTAIGDYAFRGCTGLTAVTIPEGVTTLGSFSFAGCTNLTIVTIPASMTSIGMFSFDGCSKLWHVLYAGTAEQWTDISISLLNYALTTTVRHCGTTGTEGIDPVNQVCALCNPPHTHYFSSVVTPSTCTQQGYTTYTCECGEIYVGSYTDPIPHDYTGEVTPPTCTQPGYTTYSCPCGKSYVDDYVDPTGHNYAGAVTSPTCTKGGYTTFTCPCGESYVGDYTDPAPCPSRKFTDISAAAWHHPYVDFVVERGLMNGTSGDTFAPTVLINRASVAVLLWNMAGNPGNSITENPFADVKENFWYTDAIFWAYESGIVAGNGAGGFAPNDNVTREQLAVMLCKFAAAMGYDLTPVRDMDLADFPDGESVSGWAASCVKWAVDLGLVNGKAQGGENFLAPKDTATRAEIAVIITNFVQLTEAN